MMGTELVDMRVTSACVRVCVCMRRRVFSHCTLEKSVNVLNKTLRRSIIILLWEHHITSRSPPHFTFTHTPGDGMLDGLAEGVVGNRVDRHLQGKLEFRFKFNSFDFHSVQ